MSSAGVIGQDDLDRHEASMSFDGNTNGTIGKVRILHVISSLSPAEGGPPEAVRQLAWAYRSAGYEPEIACLDDPGNAFLSNLQCPVHALGQRYLGRFALSPRLWTWMGENAHRFDAIVMNGIWTFPGLAVRHAAKTANTPYGVFVHGALDPWFNKQYPLKHLKKLIYWPIQYRVLRDAKAVFFTTSAESELARTSFYPNLWSAVVVPYGIGDPEEEATLSHRANEQMEALYRHIPKVRGRRFLLFLGRIHQKKGCDNLVSAFASIAKRAPDLDLVVAGPDQAGLQRQLVKLSKKLTIAERVHWPGSLGGDQKWGALRACEAFILPSHQENFGIAVVEALAVGRPVLISNQVNIWPEICEDKVGLVEDDSLEGTERLLSRWLALSEQERRLMYAAARPSFLKRYSIRNTVKTVNYAMIGKP